MQRSVPVRQGKSHAAFLVFIFSCSLLVKIVSVHASAGVADLTAIELTERSGVSHPRQILDFDLKTKIADNSIKLLDSEGQEVPYQLLEEGTKLALLSDLPAKSTKTWKLATGNPKKNLPGMLVTSTNENAGWYEITNGVTGIRIPSRAAANDPTPPPITGVLLRSGGWLSTDPKMESSDIKEFSVRFVEKGPLVVKVEVIYTFEKQGELKGDEKEGYYKSTITIQSGQPSILFEEETNAKVSYALQLDPIRPTQARYRGHHSSSKEFGYEPDGRAYRQDHERDPMDATVDLNFEKSVEYSHVALWNPWIVNSGHYWQTYNKEASASGDLLGVFSGRASRLLDAREAENGVRFFTGTNGTSGYRVSCQRVLFAPDVKVSRFQWGLFVGTKADLLAPTEYQPIARQMNIHAGINLNKIHRILFEFPDRPQGYGSPYMSRKALDKRIEKLRLDKEGPHGKGYHAYLSNTDPSARELISVWSDPAGEKLKKFAEDIEKIAGRMLDDLVNHDGIYHFSAQYWIGGLEMSRLLLWIDQILGSNSATLEQKAQMKAIATLFASILWDNDFVPMDNWRGINLGTPNMPVQQAGFRHQYAAYLSQHPMMKGKLPEVIERAKQILATDLHESGAHIGSVHYVGAGMGPTLNTMQQLQQAGVADLFKTETRAARFAEFFINCATPPEPRFGNLRKFISVGDGSTESSELYGQMATGFSEANPELSKQLMWMWKAQGQRHSSFHGTTLMKIDDDLPESPVRLGTANFPGYFSVLRNGIDSRSTNENAVWFINGNHYTDHSHEDQGAVVIYALGAPLSLDWGSIYEPRVGGAFMHSVALPEIIFPMGWDKESPPTASGQAWGTYAGSKTVQEEFKALENGGWSRARTAAPDGSYSWTRAVSLAELGTDSPVVALQDTYLGADGKKKIFTLNLMAEGVVETPAGPLTPEERIWGYHNHHGDKKQSASIGKIISLQPGVNRFSFSGQKWKAHPSGGINWDVYVISSMAQEAHIGNWAHAWHPVAEALGDFPQANGKPFEERQHILRIRGDSFRVVILPRLKGSMPADMEVTTDGTAILVSKAKKPLRIEPSGKIL